MAKSRAVKDLQEFNFLVDELYSYRGDTAKNIALLSYHWLLRIGDLLALRWYTVEQGMKYGYFKAKEQKTGKRKTVFIERDALYLLREMRRKRPYDKFLFQSRQYGRLSPICYATVSGWLSVVEQKLNDRRAIDDEKGIKVGTHTLRKSGARIRWQKGVSLESIQVLLNHSSIETTIAYLDIGEADLRAAYRVGLDELKYNF